MKKIIFTSILFCLSINKTEAQTFEWISPDDPEVYNEYFKIQETATGDFFVLEYRFQTSQSLLKFNRFGTLLWTLSPSNRLYDFITLDKGRSFYVLGDGGQTGNILFNLNQNGMVKKQTFCTDCNAYKFYGQLYKNQLLTYGSRDFSDSVFHPVIEFRGLNGDVLGKTEIALKQNYGSTVKLFELKDKSGFLIFGLNSYTILTSPFIFTVKTDNSGKIIKEQKFGEGDSGFQTMFWDVIEKDGSFYIFNSFFFTNLHEFRNGVIQFNQNGDYVGIKDIDYNENIFSFATTRDNGFILAGSSLIKLDSNFKVEWRKVFRDRTVILSVSQAADGGYYGSGLVQNWTNPLFSHNRAYLFKTDASGNIDSSAKYPEISIFPNPAKDELRIDLPFAEEYFINIIDLQGRQCINYTTIGSSAADISNLNPGIYLVHIKDKNAATIKTQKLLKQD
ncbi:MAG: T9SS type A sorting domain-containing protein [Bacteroidota bacterium]|nr:T9SS type A sorting domain-containing protein [Bacteroidota bacterium]